LSRYELGQRDLSDDRRPATYGIVNHLKAVYVWNYRPGQSLFSDSYPKRTGKQKR